MKHISPKLALAALLPLALSACGGGSESAPVTPPAPTPTAATAFQDKAGTAFAAAFNASATASPIDPGANDAGTLNPTAQPFDQ